MKEGFALLRGARVGASGKCTTGGDAQRDNDDDRHKLNPRYSVDLTGSESQPARRQHHLDQLAGQKG